MADRYYKVTVGNWELEEKELHYPNGNEDVKIIPVVGGEGEILEIHIIYIAGARNARY